MSKKYANKFKDGDGVWRTIGGRRVFIRTGQDLSDAMKESGKFERKKEEYKKTEVPEKMIENANKLSGIAKRTGKTDLFSEAGQEWNKLYKEDKSNISYELEDGYKIGIGYGGEIDISSRHPYDETRYSFANANIENGKIKNWVVSVPGGGTEMANDVDEAVKTMKVADEWISSGEHMKSYEGISSTGKPKMSYKDFKNQKGRQQLEDVDRKWKEQANKMEKYYDEYGTTDWRDEKKLNELSYQRDRLSIYRESPMEEEARLKKEEEESWIKEEKAIKKASKQYSKKLAEDDRISKGMTKQEYKEGKYSFGKDKEIEDSIRSLYIYQDEKNMASLRDNPMQEHYDKYGKDNVDRVWKNMDNKYMIAKGTYVDSEGLHYNKLINKNDYSKEALDSYTNQLKTLKDSGIGYYDPRRYNQKADELFKELENSKKSDYEHFAGWELYSDDPNRFGDLRSYNDKMRNYGVSDSSIRQKYEGTIKYLKETTNMTEQEIIDLLRKKGK